jgi:hypothetical protein
MKAVAVVESMSTPPIETTPLLLFDPGKGRDPTFL